MTHPSHYRPDLKPIAEPLYVVTMLENPLRWRSRYENYWAFERHMESSGAILYTAEVALGSRPFEVTEAGNSRHLQLRAHSELWRKENALNLLIQRLPADAKNIAWIDADIQFNRSDWVQETIQALQHYSVIQMFSQAQNMVQGYETDTPPARGFAYCFAEGIAPLVRAGPLHHGSGGHHGHHHGGVYWHPGFAWAIRREVLDALGGLLDCCIFGSADWHMAMALIGKVEATLQSPYTDTYRQWIRDWERRAERHVRRDVGYLPGLIFHHWHGEKKDRGYGNRYKLIKGFDPVRDIRKDTQGLWSLDPDNLELRDNLRRYARSRREDG